MWAWAARGHASPVPQLSSLDSSFLRVETPTAHMHVGWLSHLDLEEGVECLDVPRLVSSIASRLHLAPRFRQRVVEPPLGIGEPEWADDPGFRLERQRTRWCRPRRAARSDGSRRTSSRAAGSTGIRGSGAPINTRFRCPPGDVNGWRDDEAVDEFRALRR